MATYSKSVLDALTENPAQLFVDFLKFLESTQPITVPSTSAIRVTSSAPTITIPGIQPSAELTYQDYLLYRSQHPGPTSNSSFKRWVQLGGRDHNSFKWPYHPPNKGAGSRSRRGGGRGGGSGGSRGRRWNGGSLVVHGGYYNY
nr:RNA-binding motif protein, X chromosome-like isoform X16 [Hydra vulgaris]